MLGWEFPPLLTGGLGPACYGLAKALAPFVELQVVLPRAEPSEAPQAVPVVGLNQLDLTSLHVEKLHRIATHQKELTAQLLARKAARIAHAQEAAEAAHKEALERVIEATKAQKKQKASAQATPSEAPTEPQAMPKETAAAGLPSAPEPPAQQAEPRTETAAQKENRAAQEAAWLADEAKRLLHAHLQTERMLHSYEEFAVVNYVQIHLDPYERAWTPRSNTQTVRRAEQPLVPATPSVQTQFTLPSATQPSGQAVQRTPNDAPPTSPPANALPYHQAPTHPPRDGEAQKSAHEREEAQWQGYFQEATDALHTAQENAEAAQQAVSANKSTAAAPTPYAAANEEADARALVARTAHEVVASDWANKRYLFEDKNPYGPHLSEKVATYAEVTEQYAQQAAYELIHAHDWLTFPAAVALKKQTGQPLVVHIHSLETDRSASPDTRNFIYDIEKKAMEMADAVVAVSKFTAQNIRQYYHIAPEKIHVIHNAIEALETPPTQLPKKQEKRREKNILFLGRITEQKGIVQLIETAEILVRRMDNVRFLIGGMGYRLRDAMWLAQQKGISDKVRFLGFLSRPEIHKVFARTDAFFMPSVSEPFGLAALEAAQFDIPLVISKQAGVLEVLPHVLRANYWETEKFADYLHAILHHKALRNELVHRTRTDLARVRWEHSAEKLQALYAKLIRSSHP